MAVLLTVQARHVKTQSEVFQLSEGRHHSQIVNLDVVWLGLNHGDLRLVQTQGGDEPVLPYREQGNV